MVRYSLVCIILDIFCFFQTSIGNSSDTPGGQEVCMDLLDECFNEVFSKPLRCKKCFITHFPWMKICKRNNPVGWKRINAVETNVMVPKLRGGAILPKYCEAQARVRQGSARDGP